MSGTRLGTVTYVALSATAAALHAKTRAFGLDMTYSSARITLLSSRGARRGARRRLMAGLATIVTETLLRSTIFRDVAHCRR